MIEDIYPDNLLISEMFRDLGMHLLADCVSKETRASILDKYVEMLKKEAVKKNKPYLIEELRFAGLVY